LNLGEAAAGDPADYVAHRPQLAGGKQSLLSSDALAMLHEATSGSLRDIDRIATEASNGPLSANCL
jgi:general secretion pathway protein A